MLKKWHLKAAVQKAISFLPGSSRINYFFQRYVTKGVLLDDTYFGYKIQHAADHLSNYRQYCKNQPMATAQEQDIQIVELGLGWYPVVPTVFWLTGLGKTTSYDIYDWMRAETMITSFKKLLEWQDDGRLKPLFANSPFIPERLKALREVAGSENAPTRESLNELIGLTPRIQDVRRSGLDADSIDFVCSNNTFEHVHAPVLEGILEEFQRVIRPGAISSHFIDMSDHFAHFDHSINVYNFLRYSEASWKRIDNNIQPQNRLRLPHYLDMYNKQGIPVLAVHPRTGNLTELDSVPLAEPFRSMPIAEVAKTHAYVVSSK
ncbi:MAG: class I SAM-dependent methyltransferase [Bacteroidota bacterium]